MRKLSIIFFFLLIIQKIFAQQEYVDATVTRNNAYSFKYYSLFNEANENLVLSPFGVSTCMAMAYIGSEGKTQQVIAHQMNFITPFGVLFGFKQLIKRLQIYKSNDINLLIGNALWLNREIEVQKKYKNLLKVNFASHVEDITFEQDEENNSKSINRWVKKSSNYNILNIIKPENIDKDDKLFFTNFVYLNGDWDNPFNEQFTSKDDFYESDSSKIKVDFMNQTSYLKYNENDIFQIIELPYSGKNISMIVLLPKKHSDLDSLEKSLNSVNFDFWTSELYVKLVNVSIPKFRIEFLQDIAPVISSNGCELAFSDKADFSRITNNPVYISKIFQKTTIVVEENKNNNLTEQILLPEQSNKNKDNSVMEFKANQPFLFIIKDNINNSILLLGKVVTPDFNNLSAEYYNN
jgi:serine protease inhibitor